MHAAAHPTILYIHRKCVAKEEMDKEESATTNFEMEQKKKPIEHPKKGSPNLGQVGYTNFCRQTTEMRVPYKV